MSAAKNFRDQSIDELKAMYQDFSRELFRLKNELKTTRKLDKPHRINEIKRDRARVLTVLSEKGGTVH